MVGDQINDKLKKWWQSDWCIYRDFPGKTEDNHKKPHPV
jgi:hypothetical protein